MLDLMSAKPTGASKALTVRGEVSDMHEETNTGNDFTKPLLDAIKYINEATYALLPPDLAHKLGDLEKSLWSGVRGLAEKELGWIDERVEGGDRLRNEWKNACRKEDAPPATGPDSTQPV